MYHKAYLKCPGKMGVAEVVSQVTVSVRCDKLALPSPGTNTTLGMKTEVSIPWITTPSGYQLAQRLTWTDLARGCLDSAEHTAAPLAKQTTYSLQAASKVKLLVYPLVK